MPKQLHPMQAEYQLAALELESAAAALSAAELRQVKAAEAKLRAAGRLANWAARRVGLLNHIPDADASRFICGLAMQLPYDPETEAAQNGAEAEAPK